MYRIFSTAFTGLFVIACLSIAYTGNEFFDTQEHYFALLAPVLVVLWYMYRLLVKPVIVLITPLDVAITALIFYFLVNSLFVSHLTVGYLPVTLLLCCLCAWMAGRGLSRMQGFVPVVVFLALFSGIAQALWGILQQTGVIPQTNIFKVTGSFQNPGVYGNYLAGIFPLALAMALQQKTRAKNAFFIAGVLLTVTCLFILPFTMARTAWLGIMAGVLVVTEYRYGWFVKTLGWMKRHIQIGAVATGTIILVVAGVALYQLKPDSAQGRLLIWKVTAGIFGDHPLAGAGFQTFAKEYNLYQAAYFASGNGSETEQWLAGCNRLAFNDYLQTAAETGVVGLLMMFSVGGVLFYYRRQMRTPCTQGATGALASLACCACFSYPFHEIAIIVLAGLLLLVAGTEIKSLPWTLPVWLQMIAAIAVLVIAGVLCYHSVVRLQSVRRWKNVVSETTVHGFDTTQAKYLQLYPRLEDNPYFLYNFGVELLLSGSYNQSIPVLLQTNRYFTDTDIACCLGDAYKVTGQYCEAEKIYRLAANMAPNKFYPMYCLAKLYRETGDEAKAVDMANAIIDKKEKVKSYTTYKIKTEMKQMVDSLNIEN